MKNIVDQRAKLLIEAAIFVSDSPLTVQDLKQSIFADYNISNKRIMKAIGELTQEYLERGITLVKVASGYRFQALSTFNHELANLFKERAPRYSRALLETLSLIAYKQPITRGEIEDIRGVAVSSYIIKTLLERNWVKIVGHKEVPGRPALYASTKEFLDYFSLTSLAELPELMPVSELSLVELPEEAQLTTTIETET